MRSVRDAIRWVVWGTKVLARGAVNLLALVRGGRELAEPWRRYRRAEDIPFDVVGAEGVNGVLFDLENTLIPAGGPFTPDARAVVEKVRRAGLGVAVVSNASASWVRTEMDREAIPYVAPAGKPGRQAFERGCALLGLPPDEVVYVGDQVITDVIGPQRAGIRAILLEPRYGTENRSAAFQRLVVRLLRLRGRGA